jgi:phage anti-repressor protein
MKELIKIKTNENGEKLVSAKELYLGLGLTKNNWTRWYPINIEKNDFFTKDVDWIRVPLKEEGNETMDFAITLEFAKHIAMMARTEKSHQYRNYFIECEHNLIESNKLILASKEIERLEATVSRFEKLTEEAKLQYKPSHKKKLDYNKMIKSLVNNDEEAQVVKDWVFGLLNVEKWEDTCIDDSKRIIETITTVARLLTIKKFEQITMF